MLAWQRRRRARHKPPVDYWPGCRIKNAQHSGGRGNAQAVESEESAFSIHPYDRVMCRDPERLFVWGGLDILVGTKQLHSLSGDILDTTGLVGRRGGQSLRRFPRENLEQGENIDMTLIPQKEAEF